MFTTRKGTENGLLDVYINKRSVLVKEIGNTFKERREEIGIKLEEAAGDLEITVAQLENLEDGNINAFKDIFFLKELIKKYATYLNVNEEELMEDFNDFVFDYTSKIPVEEIEQKVKEIEKLEEKETRKRIRNAKMKPVYFFSVITVILVSITLIILNVFLNKQRELNLNLGSEIIYEFTK